MYIPFGFQSTSGSLGIIPVFVWSFYQTLSANRGVDVWYINSAGTWSGLTLYNPGPGTQTISGTANSPYTPWLADIRRTFTVGGAPQITSAAGGMTFPLGNNKDLTIVLNGFSVYGNTRRYFNVLYTASNGTPTTTLCFGGTNGLGGVGDGETIVGVKVMNPSIETTYTPKIDSAGVGCGGNSGTFTYGIVPVDL